MSDFLPLNIFPEGSLSSSVITTVWVGIWIVCFFNLRLGWVFSGLVIPGYLVPLILVRPYSAGVIVAEALITYALVWTFSEASPRFRKWSSLFGRERFFALVLTSIAVRLVSEAWAVPKLASWLQQNVEGISVLESDLSGYGLIVTSLIANQLWKPGLRKGLLPFLTCTFLTWVFVRWVLMEYTNFSISNLAFMYEDIAASLEAAPKAYVVLIVAAYIASRLNLKYGWEFNGILIPSLLALQWYQPMKIVTTFSECFFIYFLSSLAIRLPILRDINMEGARKFLLFFNIGFLYKLALGHGFAHFIPTFKSSDAFGYGYMLSTLLAVKMHDKAILLKMSRSTLQASFMAVFWASLLGYGMALFVRWIEFDASITEQTPTSTTENLPLDAWMREHKLSIQALREPDSIPTPRSNEKESFEKLIRRLLLLKKHPSLIQDRECLRLAMECNYELRWISDEKVLAIVEASPKKGWGTFLLRPGHSHGPSLQIPTPLSEWRTVESGAALFRHLEAGSLAMAGAGRNVNRDGSSDMLQKGDSLYAIFNRLCGYAGSLQIRGLGDAFLKREKGLCPLDTTEEVESSELLVWGAMPKGLELQNLSTVLHDLKISWNRTEGSKLPLEVQPSAHGELFLSRPDRRRLLYLHTSKDQWRDQEGPQMIAGFLTERLLDESRGILPRDSGAYVAPSLEEMLYFDEEVLTPLANEVRNLASGGERSRIEAAFKAVHASARTLGYGLTIYRHAMSDEEYIILSEEGEARKGWGTLVMRIGQASPFIVQVPRPLSERHTLETGARLFQRRKCEAMIVAGSHAMANPDRSSDPLSRSQAHIVSLYQQVLLREATESGRTVIQLRGLSGSRPENAGWSFMSSHRGWIKFEQVQGRAFRWIAELRDDGLPVRMWSGDPLDLGGNSWNVPQARYLRATDIHDFWQLWLPPEVRELFQRRDLHLFTAKTFRSVGIPTREKYILDDLSYGPRSEPNPEVFKIHQKKINTFLETGQILLLWELLQNHPGLRVERWVDLDTKGAFLVCLDKDERLLWMARLGALINQSSPLPPFGEVDLAMEALGGVERWLVPWSGQP